MAKADIHFKISQISGEPSILVNMKRKFKNVEKAREFMVERLNHAHLMKEHWTKDHDQKLKEYAFKKNPWFNLKNFEIVEYHLVKKKTYKY